MSDRPQFAQLATWLAIVSQLYTTRMTHHLNQHGFTITQFSVLNHLARHQHVQHTISDLTQAVEVNQPGATKIVKKLTGMGLLQSQKDTKDSRKKYVSITQAGLAMIQTVQQQLAPDVQAWFADWSSEEMDTFERQLQKLGIWLDSNRIG